MPKVLTNTTVKLSGKTIRTNYVSMTVLPGETKTILDMSKYSSIEVYYTINGSGYINSFTIPSDFWNNTWFVDTVPGFSTIYVRTDGNILNVSSISTGSTTKILGYVLTY